MKTTFSHNIPNAAAALEDAKRIVAIATEAEDRVLRQAVDLIRKKIVHPRTCKHLGKALSQETAKLNKIYEAMADEVQNLISDEMPF